MTVTSAMCRLLQAVIAEACGRLRQSGHEYSLRVLDLMFHARAVLFLIGFGQQL